MYRPCPSSNLHSLEYTIPPGPSSRCFIFQFFGGGMGCWARDASFPQLTRLLGLFVGKRNSLIEKCFMAREVLFRSDKQCLSLVKTRSLPSYTQPVATFARYTEIFLKMTVTCHSSRGGVLGREVPAVSSPPYSCGDRLVHLREKVSTRSSTFFPVIRLCRCRSGQGRLSRK